jgi:GH15 family glucan-1,4-alpha-glucosidase
MTRTVPPRYPPIADYALIGDCHGAALVSLDGSIDWGCFHRFDAAPVFARILDWDHAGFWQIAPSRPYETKRRYVPGTNVIETRFETDEGAVTLVDAYAMPDASNHPPHRMVRLLRGESGSVEVSMRFVPRFDFGRTVPRYEAETDSLGVVYGGADGLVLESSFEIEPIGVCSVEANGRLSDGDVSFFVLTYQKPHELVAKPIGAERAQSLVEQACRYWTEWSDRCSYDGPYRDQVVRSALVLKALTNTPTGAIIAAPTTSLPEQIGGVRNWDYRYAWLRDAALNLYSLFSLGYTEEAHAFMAWLQRTTAGMAEDLQVLYGVGGERFLPELDLEPLEGYRGSKPVRVGNAAADQFQLDVFGYLLDTSWLYHRHGGEITTVFWSFLSAIVDVVGERWQSADEGIWEVRGGPRQFVSSKVMAWVAVDRAIRLADALRLEADVVAWRELRDQIRSCIEGEGVDPSTNAFVQQLGGEALDASVLLIPLVRFLPPDDPRVISTMQRVAKDLTRDGLVYRYIETDDGIVGEEAAFTICSFWLVDNLALAGRVEEAQALFERLIALANDVGLLSEEIDPASLELLGNFPQAFSHVGLIGAALNLGRAQARR